MQPWRWLAYSDLYVFVLRLDMSSQTKTWDYVNWHVWAWRFHAAAHHHRWTCVEVNCYKDRTWSY